MVYKKVNGEWEQREASYQDGCDEQELIEIASKEKKIIDYGKWNYQLFNETGDYKIEGKVLLSKDIEETEENTEEEEMVGPQLPEEEETVKEFTADSKIAVK